MCFFWGTTYLGIRIVLEWLHPLQLMCIRYLISGGAMLVAGLFMKVRFPSRREVLCASLFGVITIGIGTGSLAFAELWIPSGLAALIVTSQPFWMIGVEALIPGGERLHGPTILGLLIGVAGTALLIGPGALQQGLDGPLLKGFWLLQIGAAGWSIGSILQRRQITTAHPVVTAAIQQMATGLFFLVPAIAVLKGHPVAWNWRGAAGVLYLAVFGGIVGYSAYIYALTKLPVSIASIYTYVNPIVALWLGWLFYREPIGPREILAMIIIFAGVAAVRRFSHRVPLRPAPAAKAQTS